MRSLIPLVLVLAAIPACSRRFDPYAPPSASPTTTTSAPARPTAPCGFRTTDWCPSPAGDPCGAHKDVASCRADAACKGMVYRGESVVACMDDGHGFPSNCPTVGCISR